MNHYHCPDRTVLSVYDTVATPDSVPVHEFKPLITKNLHQPIQNVTNKIRNCCECPSFKN